MSVKQSFKKSLLVFLMIISVSILRGQNLSTGIEFIDYYFENGSPLNWKIVNDTLVISLLPDYQRETLNRQTDHWYFKIIGKKGAVIKLTIEKMLPDVYNGKPATDWWNYKTGIPCYTSYDNKNWQALRTTTLPGKELFLEFTMTSEEIFLARLPVYTTSHLSLLLERIKEEKDIKVFQIGKTPENRPLEIIQMGNPRAKNQIILRARAHPWEPGGNWVVEGFIDEFIREYGKGKLNNFCFSIMPMANKDGVVRGMTRFNVSGMDLNRNWDKPSDSVLCPENHALEKYIEELISKGFKPSLFIDFHNDDKGDISPAIHKKSDIIFKERMQKFEKLLQKHTSFSESVRNSWIEDGQKPVMSSENGLFLRYDIDAIIYELNANWVTSRKTTPSADEWKEVGRGILHVLEEYFGN